MGEKNWERKTGVVEKKWELIKIEDIVNYDKNDSKNTRKAWMKLAEKLFKWYISSVITYISNDVNNYWDNSAIIFTLIYEEQVHLNPPILEDQIAHWSVWLWQIRTNVPKWDKDYFWYKSYREKELLDSKKHIKIMNDRINVIKEKLNEEEKKITPENIWKAWNWWPNCVKKGWLCSQHAIDYWLRIKNNYFYFKNYNDIITKQKYEKLKKEYSNYIR